MTSQSRKTVGLLAFGEMGAGIAAAFTRAGIRVVGALNGRSHISRERAIKAGVDDLADLGELVRPRMNVMQKRRHLHQSL